MLGHMARMARAAMVDPDVRGLALDITNGVAGRDGGLQARVIRSWLDSNVQFTRDPSNVELLYTPQRMVALLRGGRAPLRIDCDDVAVLAAALGGAVGLRSRFMAVGFLSPNAPISHVWTELSPPRTDQWYEMDVTRAAQGLPSFDSNVTRTWTIKV